MSSIFFQVLFRNRTSRHSLETEKRFRLLCFLQRIEITASGLLRQGDLGGSGRVEGSDGRCARRHLLSFHALGHVAGGIQARWQSRGHRLTPSRYSYTM